MIPSQACCNSSAQSAHFLLRLMTYYRSILYMSTVFQGPTSVRSARSSSGKKSASPNTCDCTPVRNRTPVMFAKKLSTLIAVCTIIGGNISVKENLKNKLLFKIFSISLFDFRDCEVVFFFQEFSWVFLKAKHPSLYTHFQRKYCKGSRYCLSTITLMTIITHPQELLPVF